MLTFASHPQELKEIQDQINSGKFFSITFIKKDGSIRYLNGKKKIYTSDSPETEKRGKWDRLEKNLLTVWDNNAVNPKTGEKGAFRVIALPRLLFVKVGNFVRDYTDENAEAIQQAGITPEQIEEIKQKMKINSMVQEEMETLLKEAESPFFRIADIPRLIKIKHPELDDKIIPLLREMFGVEVYPVRQGIFSFQPV